MSRCGLVAVLGAPNAGKSTLVNALVGQKVAIVSPKAQTTRAKLMGIAIEGEAPPTGRPVTTYSRSSARIAPGVSCSWRRRAKRPGRSMSGTASSHCRSSASPSLYAKT